jgi:hypothetical protein
MLKDRRVQGLLLVVFLSCPVLAQTNTDTPYSRFGLGQISQQGFDRGRALGGIGLGFRDPDQLNFLNPASFSSLDTMSFVFDFGVMGAHSVFKTSEMRSTYFAANLDHIALGFPLTRWWSMSVGVMPYSKVGYSIMEEATDPDIGLIHYYYTGNGGINQLNLATAVEFFNSLSIGANFKHLFGSARLSRIIDFPDEDLFSTPEIDSTILVRDFIIELGIQYQLQIGERFEITLGGIYDKEASLNAETTLIKKNTFPGKETSVNDSTSLNPVFILEDTTRTGSINIPQKIGAGITLKYNNQFSLGIDYYQQDWTNATFFDQQQPLTKSNSFRAGLEFIPNPRALTGYFNHISFRAGAHYSNTYLQLKGEQLKNYGISFGLGLPFSNANSSFNIAFMLGRRGTLENNLIQENYKQLSFSVTLYDIWFFRQKFD